MNSETRFFILLIVLLSGLVALSLYQHKQPKVEPPQQTRAAKRIDPATLTWNAVEGPRWEKRDSHAVYVFDNKLWVSGGIDADDSKVNGLPNYEAAKYYNDIWNSEDGIVWNKVTDHAEFPPIRSHTVINFKGTLYMIGGWSPVHGLQYKNGIWKSNDGIHWVKVVDKTDFVDREGQKILEWNGKLYMIGGVNYFGGKTYNDVWVSEDALHWTEIVKNAPWEGRWDHDMDIFQGKLWLLGGMSLHGVGFGDVWNTTDGITWNKVTDLAPWGKRQGQGVVTYGKYMWLVSGLDAKTNEGTGDTWFTADGVQWYKIPDDTKWLGREDHGVVVFKDKIWVLGGMDSNWHWNNDIWYTTFGEMGEWFKPTVY